MKGIKIGCENYALPDDKSMPIAMRFGVNLRISTLRLVPTKNNHKMEDKNISGISGRDSIEFPF